MSTLFKDVYSVSFYENFSEVLAQSLPSFNAGEFKSLIFHDEFESYELKERMRHTANVLSYFLPVEFADAAEVLKRIIQNLRSNGYKENSIEYMFFPEYIAMYGIEDYENSIRVLEYVTQFTSCEFAVRPYIIKYEEKMLMQMLAWSNHAHKSVRRLASEGSRPRLPWAMALPNLKKDPTLILPILNNLKQDDCENVRRSVANNLNDISKDNPEFVIAVAKKWRGVSKETDAIIKHACRTLLKQGMPDALELFDLDSRFIELSNYHIVTPRVSIGGMLAFSFSILNKSKRKKMLRLEYGLYYRKKNGTFSRKVFKISEREIEPNKIYTINRKQSFKPITTRTLYAGTHALSVIINGQENEIREFELIECGS